MALARIKTWSSGEVLTASDLNSEFNNILNNALSLISPITGAIDMDGFSITLDGAGVTTITSSAATGLSFVTGAKAGTPGATGATANFSAYTFTDTATAGSGTATSFTGFSIQRPTLAASNSTVTTTDAATLYVLNAPAAGTNETITNAYALWTDDGRVRHDLSASVVSAGGATLDAMNLPAVTATISGSTNITTATGMNFVTIGRPTLSAASALTVTNAATLYVSNSPLGAGAGPATITNAYALWVDNGITQLDGVVNVGGALNVTGDLTETANLIWQSGTGFSATLDHANTAARTYTFPDASVTLNSCGTIASGRNIGSRTNSSTPNTKFDLTADEIILKTTGNDIFVARSVNVTVDMGAVGANGIDASTQASSTWYYGWVIAKLDGTIAGLASTSTASPAMPTGYVYKALVAAVRSDGSTHFIKYRQYGNRVHLEASQNVLNSAAVGTGETTVSLSSFVPPNAEEAILQVYGSASASGTISAQATLRVVSGSVRNNIQIQQSTGSASSFGYETSVPNIAQQVFVAFSNATNFSASQYTVDVLGFKLPVGGE